jgi:hypothetical protein
MPLELGTEVRAQKEPVQKKPEADCANDCTNVYASKRNHKSTNHFNEDSRLRAENLNLYFLGCVLFPVLDSVMTAKLTSEHPRLQTSLQHQLR